MEVARGMLMIIVWEWVAGID